VRVHPHHTHRSHHIPSEWKFAQFLVKHTVIAFLPSHLPFTFLSYPHRNDCQQHSLLRLRPSHYRLDAVTYCRSVIQTFILPETHRSIKQRYRFSIPSLRHWTNGVTAQTSVQEIKEQSSRSSRSKTKASISIRYIEQLQYQNEGFNHRTRCHRSHCHCAAT
jgi:hypothetical protein